MKIAILGSGNGARAWSAQLAAKGHEVVMWEPLEGVEDFPRLHINKTIRLEGDIQLTGQLKAVTMDIEEAMRNAEVVAVVVPSFAHVPIFKKMIPHLVDGQKVILAPENFGAYLLREMMRKVGCTKRIVTSAIETMPYACRIKDFDSVLIFKRKFIVGVASSPVSANAEVCALLNDAFDGYIKFRPVEHVLMQPLANVNYVLHPYPVLLNYGEIDKNFATYRHYMDGISPLVSVQMGLLDEERIALGAALGFKLDSLLSLLKMYYGNNDTTTIYEFVNSPETPYADLVGQSVTSRYITEDVPGVVMPAVCLAKKAGFGAPRSSTIVDLSSQLHGIDYWQNGTTLEALGLGDKSIAEIIDVLA